MKKLLHIASPLIAGLLLMVILIWTPVQTQAAIIVKSGSCGENLTWTLTGDGVLTISGQGDMAQWTLQEVPWFEFRDGIVQVNIHEGVTNIGDHAFMYCNYITEISLPSTIVEIGDYAFYANISLNDIQIPDGVTYIGDFAFCLCKKVPYIKVPQSVTYIGNRAFEKCISMTGIELPKGLTEIRESLFFECASLAQIHIPDGVTSIGYAAFDGCSGLTSIDLPAGLTHLGNSAFANCTGLTEFIIPGKISKIGSSTLSNCTGLTELTIPSNITYIDSFAFWGNIGLESVTFCGTAPEIGNNAFNNVTATCYYPEGVVSWNSSTMAQYGGTLTWTAYTLTDGIVGSGKCGDQLSWVLTEDGILTISGQGEMYAYDYNAPWYAFKNSIVTIVLEEGVTSIGATAFCETTLLTKVTLPDTLVSIGASAFTDCTSLEEIYIPKNVSSALNVVFWGCTSLTSIQVDPDNQYYSCDDKGVLFNKDKTTLIWAPNRLAGVYTIPTQTTTIGTSAFYDCNQVERVIISENVTSIGNFSFSGCTAISEIFFQGNAPTFGADVFAYVTATAYYPLGNPSWTSDVRQQYSGAISWAAVNTGTVCTGEHSFGEQTVITKPRCTLRGIGRFDCTACGAYKLIRLPATDHTYEGTKTPPSDETVGYTYYTCVYCGDFAVFFDDSNSFTRQDAVMFLQYVMHCRGKKVSFNYYDTVPGSDSVAKEIFDEASQHCGVPTLGDYLTGHPIFSCNATGGKISSDGKRYYNTASYQISYTTSYPQEETVSSTVSAVMEELALEGKTDFEKIRTIHDYICRHVTYTYGYYSAYNALINQASVCQGYALLTYRLMLEAGIDCRIITGTAAGGPHAWNIVKLGDVYYNIDTTWGDQVSSIDYDYFLRNNENFKNHIRDSKYDTAEFHAQYPMTQEDFPWGICGENTYWILSEDGTLSIHGSGPMDKVSLTVCPWERYLDDIKQVTIEDGITTIGEYCFQECVNLTSITIPASVQTIDWLAFTDCTSLREVIFLGNAPDISANAFKKVTATCYYPAGNATWTEDKRQNYHGNLTWIEGDKAGTWSVGDINGDGKINMKDWSILYDHISENITLTGIALSNADVNRDGKVNMKDWSRLYEHINEIAPL